MTDLELREAVAQVIYGVRSKCLSWDDFITFLPAKIVDALKELGYVQPAPTAAHFSDAQIKHMVNRFLSWKLPANFTPDAGISFKPDFNEQTPHPMKHEPVGTNLFDATQTEEMIRYVIEGSLKQPWSAPRHIFLAERYRAYLKVACVHQKGIDAVICKECTEMFLKMLDDGTPNDSLWRELLWLNHGRYTGCQHAPYGDDGEMQCCGIDFKRCSAEQIGEYLTKRAAQGEPGGDGNA